MSVSYDEVIEKIMAKHIDKSAALSYFNQLPALERSALFSRLKAKLSERDLSVSRKAGIAPALRAVDQRKLSQSHLDFITELGKKYEDFVPKSKNNITQHQHYFVDQRRPFHLIKELKELHFQITYERAEGAYVFDIDGNKYLDISGDMGVNIFGHKAKVITDAIKDSLDEGIPLAGYSEKIFSTSRLFSELTGHERVLFTQSGTEAVMFAVRIARAATQKKKIVIFDGAYHGLSDAVTAMRDPLGNSLAAVPGMLQEFADQLIILKYGDFDQLDIVERHVDDIAGVLVEPVQSRHPYIQPVEFLRELRKLTLAESIPLIFDEMITGFRVCPRGAQGLFDIKADIATYGKIPGGGLPTGVIAGSAKYMDLIDGGTWGFGDDSLPGSKRTSMAGTHSQNPLKISAVHATLSEIARQSSHSESCDKCTCFQKLLSEKTRKLADRLNTYFMGKNLPIKVDRFGSLFRFRFVDSYWGVVEALFFILLRMERVETNIQGNCFLTTAHTDDDIDTLISAVKKVTELLLSHEFFEEFVPTAEMSASGFDDLLAVGNKNDSDDYNAEPLSKRQQSSEVGGNRPAEGQLERLMEMIKQDLKNVQEGAQTR